MQAARLIIVHNATGSPDTIMVSGKGIDPVGILAASSIRPTEYVLSQNYPNPFNPTTDIKFGLPAPSHVLLTVYDVLGRETAVLLDRDAAAGYYRVTWNAGSAAGGIYFAKFFARNPANGQDYTRIIKLLLLK